MICDHEKCRGAIPVESGQPSSHLSSYHCSPLAARVELTRLLRNIGTQLVPAYDAGGVSLQPEVERVWVGVVPFQVPTGNSRPSCVMWLAGDTGESEARQTGDRLRCVELGCMRIGTVVLGSRCGRCLIVKESLPSSPSSPADSHQRSSYSKPLPCSRLAAYAWHHHYILNVAPMPQLPPSFPPPSLEL